MFNKSVLPGVVCNDKITREELTDVAMNWWSSMTDIEKFSVTIQARSGVFLDRSTDFRNVTENDITNIFWWHIVWGKLSDWNEY